MGHTTTIPPRCRPRSITCCPPAQLSRAEKKRLYDAVQVTRTAFQRWRTGENTPDAAHVTLLLKALPDEERERLQALMLYDPRARALLWHLTRQQASR
jgi:hypothetical protein